jgi:NADH-quinone oxidoreductase subunit N
MPANILPSGAELFRFLPEIILTIVGTLVMVLDPLMPGRPLPSRLALAGLFGALWAAIAAYASPGPAFQNMLIVDGFATFFRVLVIGVGILACSPLSATCGASARTRTSFSHCCCSRYRGSATWPRRTS